MDQKKDNQKEAARPIMPDPKEVEALLRSGLPPHVQEAVARQQAQRLKEHQRNFRATLAATIAGGFAASQRHVSIEAMALDAVETADKILELVSKEPGA